MLKDVLPRPVSFRLLYTREAVRRRRNKRKFAGGDYYCPICENSLQSFAVANGTASCPICNSKERHRVDWLFMRDKTNLLDGTSKRMLHVAPELFLVSRFKAVPGLDYVTIDLDDPRAMRKMDITDLKFPDNEFDVIYCSHVLEHVLDDRKAIGEFYRVCKPGGRALLQVPIIAEKTVEDPTIVRPEDRQEAFGWWNHVRRCGQDYSDRMGEAGFDVTTLLAGEFMAEDDFTRMGILHRERYVFYCAKPG